MNLIAQSRQMAAEFIELADTHAAMITTSDLFTQNFANAFQFAQHMVNGGSYSGRESQIVFTQFKKLQSRFA
jgi:hypothetical protein